ncbi:MAG: hypothetical protein KIT43_00730 [Bauldia sp.]|nr:hypothetical protein [Bauldia sp.]
MTNRFFLSAAGAALFAAASAGTAHAADVMPIVVPVVTPVVAPPPGPVYAIRIDTSLAVDWYGGAAYDLSVFKEITARVTLASGWGFEVLTGDRLYITPPVELYGSLTGRVFRVAGPLEVGAYAGFGYIVPGGIGGYGFGGDFEYDTDRVTVEGFVQANFFGGGFAFLEGGTETTLHLTDRLDVYFGVEVANQMGISGDVWAGAQIDFGAIAPYAGIWYAFGGPVGAEFGVELEKPLGTGPFSLIGQAEINIALGGGASGFASIGIRFQRGEIDD